MKLIKHNSCWHLHGRQSKNSRYPPRQIFTKNTENNIQLKLDLPHWCNFFVPSAITFIRIPSTCNLPRFDMSAIIFLIPLLVSSSAKISFSNTLLISERTVYFTAKTSIAFCWPIYLETRKVFSLHLHVVSNPVGYLKYYSWRISSQPQECGVRLVTVTNELVLRPLTNFFPFSPAKHFSFSTSWKY